MVPGVEPRQQAPNSKFQAPKKLEVPNTEHQAPNSRQAPSSKRGPRFGAWNLGFLWCLELGFWCFDSGISLELGVSFSHLLSPLRRETVVGAPCSASYGFLLSSAPLPR